MIRRRSDTRGVATGDVIIGLSLLTLLLALVYPTLRARGFRGSLAETVSEVEVFRAGAERFRQVNDSWPAPEAPGAIPPELAGLFPGDASLAREKYTLQWGRWEVVDYVEAPPSSAPPPADAPPDTVGPELMPVVRQIGGIILHSSDGALLAELLQRYGTEASFVRDTTWTLVLPGRAGGS